MSILPRFSGFPHDTPPESHRYSSRPSIPARLVADALCAAEAFGIFLAAYIAKAVYIDFILEDLPREEPFLLVGLVGAALYHLGVRARGLTEPAAIQRGTLEWRGIFGSLATTFLVLIAAAYVFKVSANFSRGWLLSWAGLSFVLVVLARTAMRHTFLALARTGRIKRRIAVVSVGTVPRALYEAVEREPTAQLSCVFTVDPDELIRYSSAPSSPFPLAGLIEAAKDHNIDEIVIRQQCLGLEHLRVIVNELSVLPVDIWLSASDEEFDLPVFGFTKIGNMNLLQVRIKPIGGWGFVLKSVLDFTLALIGLILLAPLFAIVAAAIKFDSPGPVFFRQRRHGYNEREIKVYKFRTMTVTEDGTDVKQAGRNDKRVTKVGRILRATSLDELPQLINVLKGEMSLVGPRPHALVHNDFYRTRVRSYANRHKVKPGITGLAQIHGLRGETDTPEKMEQRVEKDLYYIENWSIWLDLKILLLTPIFGFVSRNAY
jgi:putative colanic acid biosynthesis UDP-glucose lipid carrier transferase